MKYHRTVKERIADGYVAGVTGGIATVGETIKEDDEPMTNEAWFAIILVLAIGIVIGVVIDKFVLMGLIHL